MILKPRLFRKPRKGHWATKGLVGLWLMNEGSGDKVYDLSGNGNIGTFVGDTHFVGGKFGPVLDFDGTGDYVVVSDGALRSAISSEVTIATWAYVTADGVERRIFDRQGDYSLVIHQNNIKLWIENVWNVTGASVSTGLHYIVGTFSDLENKVKVYVDGVLKDERTENVVIAPNAAANSYIGCKANLGNFWLGQIDHVLIYDRVLSASEIAKLYLKPFAMFERDEIELWVGATSVGVAPPTGMAGAMTTNTGYWGW